MSAYHASKRELNMKKLVCTNSTTWGDMKHRCGSCGKAARHAGIRACHRKCSVKIKTRSEKSWWQWEPHWGAECESALVV